MALVARLPALRRGCDVRAQSAGGIARVRRAGRNLVSQDAQTSYAAGYGDAFFAIGLGLFNGVVALVGAIAVALRKPPAASKNERERTGEDRRDRPR